MLCFNSGFCSLGVCVYTLFYGSIYTAWACDIMGFDGFLCSKGCPCICAHVSLCVGMCVSERSVHIVIQETHMIACDWDVRHSRLPAQTVQRAGAAKLLGCKHLSAAQRRQVGLEASGRRCVVSSLESRRRMLLKLPCGLSASLSAACTVTSRRRGMESEKEPCRGCFNCSYKDSVTY